MDKKVSQAHFLSSLKSQKRAIISDYLPWLIIGIATLAVLMFAVLIMREKGISLIDKVKDLIMP
ncbi:hypothetical protein HY448_02220 [Candidatus Pacearchaeota archaeon]|nr:hypothetical protein [Candidatus Pacearchaeota archaeon]